MPPLGNKRRVSTFVVVCSLTGVCVSQLLCLSKKRVPPLGKRRVSTLLLLLDRGLCLTAALSK